MKPSKIMPEKCPKGAHVLTYLNWRDYPHVKRRMRKDGHFSVWTTPQMHCLDCAYVRRFGKERARPIKLVRGY